MEHIIFPIVLFILSLLYALRKPELIEDGKNLILNMEFGINFLFIIVFIVWIGALKKFKNDKKEKAKAKESLKKATIAFIIGLFGELHLIHQPFWLIFILAYYMDGWV